jgi:hypothetical protein
MKALSIIVSAALGLLFMATTALAHDVYVNGYYRSDGTYVQPYYRTRPNSTTLDNYSTKGNVNPYTGQPGTHDPYGSGSSNPYSGYSNPCSGYGNQSGGLSDPYD